MHSYINFIDLVSWGMVLLMIWKSFTLLPGYFWWVFLCCILISSLLSTHIETKLLLKATCLFKYEWNLHGHQALNGWHMLKMFTAHPSLGPWERRLFTLRKFIKLITLRQICIFPQFPLSPILIKQMHFCFCFRRKATLLKVTSTTKLFFVIK